MRSANAAPYLASALVLAFAVAGCDGAGSGAAAPGTAPEAAGARSGTAAAEDAQPAGIELPPGFRAAIFADGLERPRHIAVNANGDVYITLRSGAAQIVPEDSPGGVAALRDTDGDGRADVVERFGRQDAETGIAIRDGVLYYSSADTVYAVPLEDGQLVPGGEAEVVVGGFGNSGAHSAKPIAFDGAGHLYLQAGVPSNACQEQDRTPGSPGQSPCPLLERFGGVWRFSAEARNQDQIGDGIRYSTGHRNAVALEWNPVADRLYLVMHGRDQLDQLWPEHFTAEERTELPAEEFHAVDQGDDLGWPYTYYDQIRGERMVGPEYGGDGETPAEPGRYEEPLIGFPGHWAPNDLVFYTGASFPERYRGGAFIAFHGSWNRAGEQGGYNVVFVPMRDGLPTGDYEVFADGFEGPTPIESPAAAAHRPTGLAIGPDGALYVTDDVGGRVYKVTYEGEGA